MDVVLPIPRWEFLRVLIAMYANKKNTNNGGFLSQKRPPLVKLRRSASYLWNICWLFVCRISFILTVFPKDGVDFLRSQITCRDDLNVEMGRRPSLCYPCTNLFFIQIPMRLPAWIRFAHLNSTIRLRMATTGMTHLAHQSIGRSAVYFPSPNGITYGIRFAPSQSVRNNDVVRCYYDIP